MNNLVVGAEHEYMSEEAAHFCLQSLGRIDVYVPGPGHLGGVDLSGNVRRADDGNSVRSEVIGQSSQECGGVLGQDVFDDVKANHAVPLVGSSP